MAMGYFRQRAEQSDLCVAVKRSNRLYSQDERHNCVKPRLPSNLRNDPPSRFKKPHQSRSGRRRPCSDRRRNRDRHCLSPQGLAIHDNLIGRLQPGEDLHLLAFPEADLNLGSVRLAAANDVDRGLAPALTD